MNNAEPGDHMIFTPDTEPYLGRESVFCFDKVICSCLEANTHVATYTRINESTMTGLQRAACQLIPQGIHLALSIRELVRQGYLLGAAVLVRPLLERAAIVSHLHSTPADVALWESGWQYRERPDLLTMLKSMSDKPNEAAAKSVKDIFNHVVHGDPAGSSFNLVDLGDGHGYAPSKMLDSVELCDFICHQSLCYLIVLMGMMVAIFPEANVSVNSESEADPLPSCSSEAS